MRRGVERDRLKGLVALFAALGGGTTVGPDDPDGEAKDADATRTDLGETPEGSSALLAGMSLSLSSHDTASTPAAEHDGSWAVALAGLQDEDGIGHVTRDLMIRFPEALAGHAVIARRYQRLTGAHHLHTAWFRMFVTGFDRREDAEAFCTTLAAQMQRAQPVATSDPLFQKGRRLKVVVTAPAS